MTKDSWIESDDPDRISSGMLNIVVKWVLVLFLLGALLSVSIWVFRVQFADKKGEGDAKVRVESGDNRLGQDKYFIDTYEAIKADDKKITAAYADVQEGSDPTARIRYNGVVSICTDAVAAYNSAAKAQVSMKWRPLDMPAQIDSNNPLTDCKENPK